MSNTSYYLYQKYEQRGSQEPIPVYPNVWSVDGEGTMPKVKKMDNDPNCGYVPPAEPIYRWTNIDISTDYICDDCQSPTPQYRWVVTSGYECSGTSKMTKEIKQVSFDSGSTWENVVPEESRAALPVIESASTDCGYVPTPISGDYLTFVAQETGTFKFSGNNSVSYSLDSGSTWNSLASNTDSPTVSAGSKILWKASLTPASSSGIGRFSSTAHFTVEGNIMSLLYDDNFSGQTSLSGKNYSFMYLFSGCTGMTSAENLSLPATTLADGCYSYMFYGCTSLTTAPELPATTLASFCYYGMFQGCTSLITAPSLPATTLASGCYAYMFRNCTSLTTAPELPATTLASYCYQYMFNGCSNLNSITCLATNISASGCTYQWVNGVASSGTFTKASSMTSWTEGSDGIPSGWTVVNA